MGLAIFGRGSVGKYILFGNLVTDTMDLRYMGLFHEIPPAEDALQCLDCHSPDGRMDWQALGYDGDPLATRRTLTTDSSGR